MTFEFATATRIIFGAGSISQAAPAAAGLGKRACVVTGRSVERSRILLEQLKQQKIDCVTFSVSGEPTTGTAKAGIETALLAKTDFVISIGGGSAIDTGKVIAAMLTNSGPLEDYLEVVGKARPLLKKAAPHIAIPTTAGTGSEVTRNSVLGVPEHKVKVSMRNYLMLPHLAVVDPELTYSMPPAITAVTGLDALAHLIEAYVSKKANPLTDGICREGLKRAGMSLLRAYKDGSDKAARQDMSIASLFGGLALSNAGLGAVHGLAGPLGGFLSASHGQICAALMPFVMQANIRKLQNKPVDRATLLRYDEIAHLLTGNSAARADDGVKWALELCNTLKMPSLSDLGLNEEVFTDVAAKSWKSSSMKGNPVELTENELLQILKNSA
jgi:alcohol dehydrogenase class IV